MIKILNLGAGVQSTALCLMSHRGDHGIPRFDHAIFADTGDEPKAVYTHLDWLRSHVTTFPIHVLKPKYSLSESMVTPGAHYESIPVFLEGGGMTRRQCSSGYKIAPIEKYIRRTLLNLKPRQRAPRDTVFQFFGLSFDEGRRIFRVKENFKSSPFTPVFPLWDIQFDRRKCADYLAAYGIPHTVPRSACVFCPYHSDKEWRRLKEEDPEGFAKAVSVEKLMVNNATLRIRSRAFLHRDRIPLDQVDFDKQRNQMTFPLSDCEGVCGV